MACVSKKLRPCSLGVLLAGLSLSACATVEPGANELIQSQDCYAWIAEGGHVVVRAKGNMSYEIDEPLASWGENRAIVTIGTGSVVIGTNPKPGQLVLSAIAGAGAGLTFANGETKPAGKDLGVGPISYAPVCTPEEAALAVASVVYLATIVGGDHPAKKTLHAALKFNLAGTVTGSGPDATLTFPFMRSFAAGPLVGYDFASPGAGLKYGGRLEWYALGTVYADGPLLSFAAVRGKADSAMTYGPGVQYIWHWHSGFTLGAGIEYLVGAFPPFQAVLAIGTTL